MLKRAERVLETTTTEGTGPLTLLGTSSPWRGFVAGAGNAGTVKYVCVHRTANEWEEGIGVVTDASPDTLSRLYVSASSNSGAPVNLSAGIKDVFIPVDDQSSGPVINVTELGAKFDGVTDNSAFVVAAAMIAKASGGIVQFPEGIGLGNFHFGADMANVTFRGAGNGATILKRKGNPGDSNSLIFNFTESITQCTIEDLGFDMNGIGLFGGAISFQVATDLRIFNCRLFDSNKQAESGGDRYGIVGRGHESGVTHKNVWVRGCTLENLQFEVMHVQGMWIDDNEFKSSTTTINVGGSNVGPDVLFEEIWITKNRMNTGPDAGYCIGYFADRNENNSMICRNIFILDNILRGTSPSARGINMGTANTNWVLSSLVFDNIHVERNTLYQAAEAGASPAVWFAWGANSGFRFTACRVVGNRVYGSGNADNAFDLRAFDKGTIKDNYAIGMQYGLAVHGNPSDNNIEGNMMGTSIDTYYYDVGTGGRNRFVNNRVLGTPSGTRYNLTAAATDEIDTNLQYALTFGSAIDINAALGRSFTVSLTTNAAHTFNAPTNPTIGKRFALIIRSATASPAVATFNAAFVVTGYAPAANGFSNAAIFEYDGVTAKWQQITPWIISAGGAGTGNVQNSGTPVADQLAIWTNAATIKGATGLGWNGSTGLRAVGETTAISSIQLIASLIAATTGNMGTNFGGKVTIGIRDNANVDNPLAALTVSAQGSDATGDFGISTAIAGVFGVRWYIDNAGATFITGATTITGAVTISGALSVVVQTWTRGTLTYGASIAINAGNGNSFSVTVTDGAAHAFASPSSPSLGQEITLRIRNTFGAIATATFHAIFKQAGYAAPANGFNTAAKFEWDGTNWNQSTPWVTGVPN